MKPASSTTHIGRWAEALAQAYLNQQGLVTLERNYRCKLGEIDLIMQQLEQLIFIEVRYRIRPENSLESIDARKQQRLLALADFYLYTHRHLQPSVCRFDVVLLSGPKDHPQLRWISDAFRGD
jgi:putative endonuclease